MNQKVYHTLEYYKILERLADYASCEEAKDRCHKLVPLTDPAEIAHLQETTADALSRLYRGSGISFSGVHNVNASLKRLDIGGTFKYHRAPYDLFSVGSCQAGQSIRPKRPQR